MLQTKKIIIAVIGVVLIFGLIVSGVMLFLPSKQIAGDVKFSLTSEKGKSVMIAKDEKLILKTNQNFSENEIKKILVFKPEVSIGVKKMKKLISLGNFVNAAESENSDLSNSYEITPENLKEGEVYGIEIASSTNIESDHQYSWAFQVEALFQAISSFPGDKSSDVPLNTGIEISFNRDRITNYENNFSIEPSVSGKFELRYDTLTFIPEGNLKEKTLYTVSIKKGVGRESTNELTSEDFVFAFETETQNQNEQRKEYINWTRDYYELQSKKNSFFPVYSSNILIPEVTIYKFEKSSDFRDEYFRFRNRFGQWTNWNEEAYVPEKATLVKSFKPTLIQDNWQRLIEAPDDLDDGYYVMAMEYNGQKNYAFAQKSPFAFYYSTLNINSLFWIYDYENKTPASDMSISLFDGINEQALGKTDVDGVLKFNTPDSFKAQKDRDLKTPIYFEVKKEGQMPLVVISDDLNLEKSDKYWNYLMTDRPIYQLKDKVNFWGAVKGRDVDMQGKKLSVGLYQNWDAEDALLIKEVIVTPFGTYSGNLDFAGIDPGYYTIVAKFNDDVVSRASIQILTYAKPLYKLEVSSDKENYWTGEEVKFSVKASFFDGTPLANTKLKYYLSWQKEVEGQITLNDKGEGEFRYKPEYYFNDGDEAWTEYPQSLGINISPASSEEGEISGNKYVSIFGPNIYLQASAEKISGEKYKIEARTNKIDISDNDYIGDPQVAQKLSAKIIKYYYIKKETGEVYDPIYKVKTKQYNYELRNDTIETINGETNDEGKWTFERDLPKVDYGWYRIIFSGKDGYGRDIKAAAYTGYDYYPGGNLYLSLKNIDSAANKYPDGYKAGDQINFEASIRGEGELLDKKIMFFRFTDRIGKIEVTEDVNLKDVFIDEYIPSVRYTAVAAGPNGFLESGAEMIMYNRSEKNLDVSIQTDKEKYRPKENIKLQFNVKDKDKNNIKAALNASVVDEALFNILPSYQGDILSSIYTPLTSWPISKSTVYYSRNMGAEKGGCFLAGTMIKTNLGEKAIEQIKIGDVVLTRDSEIDPVQKSAVVQNVSSHLVPGYMIINHKLNLTPEHVIYLNGKWQMAGKAKLGDDLLDENNNRVKITSIEIVPQKNVRVYNLLVGKYHTYFANGVYVHNAEKGGGGDIRSNFIDVPLFQDLLSDGNGNASAEFKAPDNITSWRVTANAFEINKMLAGSNSKLVPVGLPLFVDVVLNKFYLAGDSPILKLRAFGTDKKDNEPLEFSITSPELGLDQKINTLNSEVEIPIGALKQGNYKILIGVKQVNNSDMIEREISVVDNYFRHGVSEKTDITNSRTAIKGNENGFTRVAFVDGSSGKYFYDIISMAYSGDLRSDRQVAGHFAQRLLEKYFDQKNNVAPLDLNQYYHAGISLLPYSDDDLALSAKISDIGRESVSEILLKNYFASQMNDKKADIKRIAMALYGSASLSEPVLDKIDYLKNSGKLDNESRVYLGLALVKIGAKEVARELYVDIASGYKDYKGGIILNESDDENHNLSITAMSGVLASYLDEKNDLEKIWITLATVDSSKIAIELEKMMIIQNELNKSNPEKSGFDYKTSAKSGTADLSEGKSLSLYLSQEDLKNIEFSNIVGKPVAISYYEEGTDPKNLTTNDNVQISRQYFVDGKATTEFKDGELVQIRLDERIGKNAPQGDYNIIDFLPSGLKPMTDVYAQYRSIGDGCNPIWYPMKIVDNAVYFNIGQWFLKTDNCPHRTLNYYARVVNKGEFNAQPAIIQAVDDDRVLNLSGEEFVKIK